MNTAANKAAIVYASMGACTAPVTAYQVSIIDDGVAQLKFKGKSPLRLAHPHQRFSQTVVQGLLRLAEAEGFFAMPALITGTPIFGMPTTLIRIHTAEGTKAVEWRWRDNTRYTELLQMLRALTPLCRGSTAYQSCV
jgi:hypothetical protein